MVFDSHLLGAIYRAEKANRLNPGISNRAKGFIFRKRASLKGSFLLSDGRNADVFVISRKDELLGETHLVVVIVMIAVTVVRWA